MTSPSPNESIPLGRRPGGRQWAACIAVCALSAGCATQPPPRDLDLRGAQIVAGTSTPALDINGLPGGKAAGAAVGAGTGSGAGVVTGAVLCLAAGPFFPLCVAALVPTGAAIGAATGLVVGAVRTESTAAIELKTAAVKSEFIATSYQTRLAEALHERLQAEYSLDLPVQVLSSDRIVPSEADASPAESPLEMVVSITEVGTEGKREFALRLVTGLVLRRGSAVVWKTAREVQSDTELTIDQWTASDAKALHGVLDLCVRAAAGRLVAEIGRGIAGSRASQERTGGRYSTSCDDRPADWQVVVTQP